MKINSFSDAKKSGNGQGKAAVKSGMGMSKGAVATGGANLKKGGKGKGKK